MQCGYVDCGDSVTGSIVSYEIEYLVFNLRTGYSEVEISTCGSSYDTYLYFYDENGGLVTSCDDCGSCGYQTILTLCNVANGFYYIGVGGYSSSSGTYVLEIT